MNDRFRTTLASAALVASLSVAGVANANGGGSGHPGPGKGKAKPCKKKHGKGYEAQGLFVSGDLEQVAGADTPRWGDDRWSGTVVVEVLKGNKRGRRDVGLSSYAVSNVRVVGAKDGVIPDEGTRLQLIGKQNAACAPAPTTPTTPTTPPPTTEPSATLAEYPREDEEEIEPTESAEPSESEDSGDAEDEGKPKGKDRPSDDGGYPGKGKDRGGDESGDDEDASTDEEEASDEPTPVTDVTIRVVHFKVGPAAARKR